MRWNSTRQARTWTLWLRWLCWTFTRSTMVSIAVLQQDVINSATKFNKWTRTNGWIALLRVGTKLPASLLDWGWRGAMYKWGKPSAFNKLLGGLTVKWVLRFECCLYKHLLDSLVFLIMFTFISDYENVISVNDFILLTPKCPEYKSWSRRNYSTVIETQQTTWGNWKII